jgi:hypothetical protein
MVIFTLANDTPIVLLVFADAGEHLRLVQLTALFFLLW